MEAQLPPLLVLIIEARLHQLISANVGVNPLLTLSFMKGRSTMQNPSR
jgi:hypothetical protein